MVRQRALLVALAACLALLPLPARGEVFLLRTGGRLEAEHLNTERAPADPYYLRTPLGVRLALSPSQVLRVVVKTDVEKQYEALLPTLAATAEAHWQMAEWCKEAGLLEERKRHLGEVIDLEADHEAARAALGFFRVGSAWMTQEEYFVSRGYVRSGGQWKLPQHVELEAAERQRELTEKKYRRDIRNWCEQIAERRNVEDARRKLIGVRDPLAAAGLADVLADDEQPREVRLLCLDQLAKLPPGLADSTLVRLAMEEKEGNLRDRCLDELARSASRLAVAYFISELKSGDNKRVNRAAECLGRLGDPSATLPLIDALVTTHTYVQAPPNGGGIGFNSAGGFSAGGRPKRFKRDHENPQVNAALVTLHEGVRLGYDEDAWRKWYAAKFTSTNVDLRRDE
jgi:hypothetical protein